MDNETYQALHRRIQQIENQVTPLNPKKSNSLIAELTSLTHEMNKIYKAHEELGVLMKIIDELKLWKKVENMRDVQDSKNNAEISNVYDSSIDILDQDEESEDNLKQKMVELNYPVIQDAFLNVEQLELIDHSKLINYIDSSQEKVHNFNQDKYTIAEREKAIRRIADDQYKVLLKNMIVFEKYLDLVTRENKFWLDIKDQIQDITREVNKYENDTLQQNKY